MDNVIKVEEIWEYSTRRKTDVTLPKTYKTLLLLKYQKIIYFNDLPIEVTNESPGINWPKNKSKILLKTMNIQDLNIFFIYCMRIVRLSLFTNI